MNDDSVRSNEVALKQHIHISMSNLYILDLIRLFTASLVVHLKESLLFVLASSSLTIPSACSTIK